jgi:hypothetical protein
MTGIRSNREKNREFSDFEAISQINGPTSPIISGLSALIPYTSEQGNSAREQGISRDNQGIP